MWTGASGIRPTWTAASLGNALQSWKVYLLKVLMQCSPPQRTVEQATAMEFEGADGHPHAASVPALTRRSWKYQSCLGAPYHHLLGSATSAQTSCGVRTP